MATWRPFTVQLGRVISYEDPLGALFNWYDGEIPTILPKIAYVYPSYVRFIKRKEECRNDSRFSPLTATTWTPRDSEMHE